jgi:conjugal transfer pilus assembly protein TraD
MGSAGGNGKPFQDFAYEIIYHTANALRYLGEPIRLTALQRVISSDRRGLAIRVFKKYFKDTLGEGYEGTLDKELRKIGSADELEGMFIYYNAIKKHRENIVVEGMAQFALHDAGHYAKMVVTLRPVLTALTADPLDQLLSPIDDPTVEDSRPIVDIKSVIEKGGCIYVSLDSLTDAQSAGYISRLILAEIAAAAGERYNNDDKFSRRVTIANDEVHASLENNNALLNILAQGRAAQMQMILATQTVADLEAKSDPATAKRFLGLCNNFVSFRTTDPMTQEYVSLQFSTTSIAQVQAQSGSGSSTATSLFEYSSSYGERLMKTRENAFPEDLLGQLPILQYVARWADGRKLKMRLPVLINKDRPGQQAPWVKR